MFVYVARSHPQFQGSYVLHINGIEIITFHIGNPENYGFTLIQIVFIFTCHLFQPHPQGCSMVRLNCNRNTTIGLSALENYGFRTDVSSFTCFVCHLQRCKGCSLHYIGNVTIRPIESENCRFDTNIARFRIFIEHLTHSVLF